MQQHPNAVIVARDLCRGLTWLQAQHPRLACEGLLAITRICVVTYIVDVPARQISALRALVLDDTGNYERLVSQSISLIRGRGALCSSAARTAPTWTYDGVWSPALRRLRQRECV